MRGVGGLSATFGIPLQRRAIGRRSRGGGASQRQMVPGVFDAAVITNADGLLDVREAFAGFGDERRAVHAGWRRPVGALRPAHGPGESDLPGDAGDQHQRFAVAAAHRQSAGADAGLRRGAARRPRQSFHDDRGDLVGALEAFVSRNAPERREQCLVGVQIHGRWVALGIGTVLHQQHAQLAHIGPRLAAVLVGVGNDLGLPTRHAQHTLVIEHRPERRYVGGSLRRCSLVGGKLRGLRGHHPGP